MHASEDRTPSALPSQFFAPGLLALFAADPLALETLRRAGRWLATQVAPAPGPATVDQMSRLRVKLAAEGVACIAGMLMDCAAPSYLADLVAQQDFAASWRYDSASRLAIELQERAERLLRLAAPPETHELTQHAEFYEGDKIAALASESGTDEAQAKLAILAVAIRSHALPLRAARTALAGVAGVAEAGTLANSLAGLVDGLLLEILPSLLESLDRHATAVAAPVPAVDRAEVEALAVELAGHGIGGRE